MQGTMANDRHDLTAARIAVGEAVGCCGDLA
jgi:hypothetical protein